MLPQARKWPVRDNDEKYFVVPQQLNCDVFPDEDITDEQLAKEFFPVIGHKSHPTKIMVFAIVTKPKLNPNWTRPWRSAADPHPRC